MSVRPGAMLPALLALLVCGMARADQVLLDEYWATDIQVTNTEFREVDSVEEGDPALAVSGEWSALIENQEGGLNLRFRGAGHLSLADTDLGVPQITLRYRTDSWDGVMAVSLWCWYMGCEAPVEVLAGALDGGGEDGRFVADGAWHEAKATLKVGPGYHEPPRDGRTDCFVWLRAIDGWDIAHQTLVDRIELRVLGATVEAPPMMDAVGRVRPSPGACTIGNGWVWWEGEDAIEHTFPPGGAEAPSNAEEQKVLSNDAWLQYHGAPVSAKYRVQVPAEDDYTLWQRGVGDATPYYPGLDLLPPLYRMQWDGGDWTENRAPEEMPEPALLNGSIPVAWLRMASVHLTAGEHTLWVDVPTEDPTKPAVACFDCWLLTTSDETPVGRQKPANP